MRRFYLLFFFFFLRLFFWGWCRLLTKMMGVGLDWIGNLQENNDAPVVTASSVLIYSVGRDKPARGGGRGGWAPAASAAVAAAAKSNNWRVEGRPHMQVQSAETRQLRGPAARRSQRGSWSFQGFRGRQEGETHTTRRTSFRVAGRSHY